MEYVRSSLLKARADEGRPAWQSSLDILRLQQLPHARQIMQRCRSEHKMENASTPEPPHASAGAAPPRTAAENKEKEKEGGAKRILCKIAVHTGLSFFFFMLERDAEAKSFLLQSCSSFLADLQVQSCSSFLADLQILQDGDV
jgi:hypothetical protein